MSRWAQHDGIHGARLLVVMAGAFAFVATLPATAPAQNDEPAARDPFVIATAKVRPSVAAVGSYDRKDTPTVRYYGTGFVVGGGNIVATNAHVVEALRQTNRLATMRVFFPDDSEVIGRDARLLGEDRLHDVAVLRFDGPPVQPLELRSTDRGHPPQGSAVGIIGYPVGLLLGLVPAVHGGRLSAVVPAVLPLPKGAKMTPELAEVIKNPYKIYQLDIVALPGNSGSPLFDAHTGQVLGILNKVLGNRTREHLIESPTGISYAVPGKWIEELIIRSLIEEKKNQQSHEDRGQATRR
jgi:S1-C subfamily serine protease